jgi:ribosomal protein S18 acetylase RimI-like enzyme
LRSLLDAPEAFGQRHEEAIATPNSEWQSNALASSAGNRRIWFLARNESLETPIGVVQARRRQPFDCLLFSMWVAPEARRLGVGSMLIDAVQEWSASWGARRIVLWVLAANESAARFYDRIGFTVLNDGPDAESGHVYGAFAMERKTNAT